jgi:hypothetical protein
MKSAWLSLVVILSCAAAASPLFVACSRQGEGARCDRRFDQNGTSDCGDGLSCRVAADLGGPIVGCDIADPSCGVCCPASGGTGACAGQASLDAGINLGVNDASASDSSRSDASADTGSDAQSDAAPTDAGNDGATDSSTPVEAGPDATVDSGDAASDSSADAGDAN